MGDIYSVSVETILIDSEEVERNFLSKPTFDQRFMKRPENYAVEREDLQEYQ